jgi:hypothetical protein
VRRFRFCATRPTTCTALAAWVALPPHPLELAERLEQLRPLAAGMSIGVALVEPAPLMGGIDTEADLARANALWGGGTAARGARVRVDDHTFSPGVEA